MTRIDVRYELLIKYRSPRLYERLSALRSRLYGTRVRVDASSVCQLRCLACSTAQDKIKKSVVGRGVLKVADFEKLLDENPSIRQVELSNWGEIFLNPEIKEIMRVAHERNVYLKAANGVNFNKVKDDVLESLVRYRFRYISVSIDGISQDTYARYRVGGNFDRVIKNVRKLNEYKKRHGSAFPQLAWQFIIFGHNEHELPRAREMARELGMKFSPKLNHTPSVFPVKNSQFVNLESGFGSVNRDEYRRKNKREYSFPCGQLWDNVQINWDGKLLGCCVNKWGDFGNVFEDGLEPTLQGERYVYAKQMILGLAPPRDDIPCTRCRKYQQMNAGT